MDVKITIPQEDPVRLVSAQLEELDYRELYRAYSSRGRESAAEPRIIDSHLPHGTIRSICASLSLNADRLICLFISLFYHFLRLPALCGVALDISPGLSVDKNP